MSYPVNRTCSRLSTWSNSPTILEENLESLG